MGYRAVFLVACLLCSCGLALWASVPGPSIVWVSGRQLMVRKRLPDGTLAPASAYTIRGVNWSPASKDTNTWPLDPNNANVRRPEFGKWYRKDIPLLRSMNVNTVRTFLDPGFDETARAVLDELYRNNIMVVLTVDDAVNNMARVAAAVDFYKDHPAVLMWLLGNEWNINRYYGVASSVEEAAARTEKAAALIKSLDANHPVATSYGEIHIDAPGLRLTDTSHYVNDVCPSVDIWGLNIYRGSTFGNLFEQWAALSSKPMFLGEFGTDAFRSYSGANPPPGAVDEGMQADWTLCLWNDLFNNLSARNSSKVALGGFVFEWNDEWWKVSPAGSQQANGYSLAGGHPDSFANEEYFGIVDIDRRPREVFCSLRTAFEPVYQGFSEGALFRVVSRGALAQEYSPQYGVARFYQCGRLIYEKTGGGGGGRGFNVLAVDPATGNPLGAAQNFDTWLTRDSGTAMNALIEFLNGLPNGALVLIAVADEAGLTLDNSCVKRSSSWTEAGLQALEALGSRRIRDYCFRDSWAMVSVKGQGSARAEMLAHGVAASVTSYLPALACQKPAAAFRCTQAAGRLLPFGSSAIYNGGGVLGSELALAQDIAGNNWIAARDALHGLWLNRFDTGPQTWIGWLPAGGIVQGVPAVAGLPDGTAYIAARDTWNSYWLTSYTLGTGFGPWLYLAGIFSTDPVMCAAPDGSLYIIGKDNWNSLWSGRYVPGSGFQNWVWGMGIVKGKPSVACGTDGAAYVAARDMWDSLWMARVSGNTWTGWHYGGGIMSADPQAASAGAGVIYTVIRDTWGGIWYRGFAGGTGANWQSWVFTGGILQDFSPAGLAGELYITGRDAGNGLWWYRATTGWTWADNVGVAAGPLAAAPR